MGLQLRFDRGTVLCFDLPPSVTASELPGARWDDRVGAVRSPAFALTQKSDPANRWLLEIVGFWTPDYLERKCRRLEHIPAERPILCVDESLQCSPETSLPARAQVIPFRRRIDPKAVLRVLDGSGS